MLSTILVQKPRFARGATRRTLRQQRFHRFLARPKRHRFKRGQCKLLPVLSPQAEAAIDSGEWTPALSLAVDAAIAQADARHDLEFAGVGHE